MRRRGGFIYAGLMLYDSPPAPPPLREIVHVRSSELCTTLRENLFQAVEGLRVNDGMIDQGRLLLRKIATDSVTGASLQLDNVQLGQVAYAVEKNLEKIDRLLADIGDQRAAAVAKASLEAVANEQRAELSLLAGTYDQNSLDDLLSRGDQMKGMNGKAAVRDKKGMDLNGTATRTPLRAGTSDTSSSIFTNSTYGRSSNGVAMEETMTQQTENNVLPVMLPLVDACTVSATGVPMPELPIPQGWHAEHIAFPLDFAPRIPYHGSLELRFTPNMFDPAAPEYFSYAYMWWIEGSPPMSTTELERDLTLYYQGLAANVGGSNHLAIPAGATQVDVSQLDAQHWVAMVRTLDAFNGARPLELKIEVTVQPHPEANHEAVLFSVAPPHVSPEIRSELDGVVKLSAQAAQL